MADEERVCERVLYPDEPTKAALLRMDSLYSIIRDSRRWMGVVTWDSIPPAGVSFQTHKFSFIDALETGFCFLRTRFTDEWVVLGPVATAIMRTLPQFVPKDVPETVGRYILFGSLGNKKIYGEPDADNALDWWVGCRGFCVRGTILNSNIVMTPPRR